MKKTRVAVYGFSRYGVSFVDAVRSLRKHFEVESFEETADVLRNCGPTESPFIRIVSFNPHILVVGYPGNGLELYKLLKQRIHFLPVVLSMDSTALKALEAAGIEEWQVVDMAIEPESFAAMLLKFKQKHIDK
jgi:hypothetical protein